MKTMIFTLATLFIFSTAALAGNGVERGSVVIKTSEETTLEPEILKYLGKSMSRCSKNTKNEFFEVTEVSLTKDRVDQGIVDFYYKIKLKHFNANNESLNDVTAEIVDSDFHNWRDYEEKLSIEILNDQNNQCI